MKRWQTAIAPMAVVVLAVGCGRGPKKDPPPAYQVDGDVVTFLDEAARDATIRVHPVARSADGHVTVTGRLVWDEDATVRVFVPVGGRVERILADLGAPVASGSALATLASPDFGQAQADAARARADLQAAERTLARAQLLLDRGAAPRKDVEQAEVEVARTRAEAERTRERLSLWGGALGAVDEKYRILSPVGGVVVERNLNPGQEVRPDATTPLFVISDPRRLWVLLDVTERDLPEMAPGASLVVRSPAYPDRSFSGTLDVVGATLDPATRTVRARGKLRSPEGLLKAEMYVTVEVIRSAASRYVVVPARSVLQDGGKQFVFLEESPGRYRRVQVAVGAEHEGAVPVLSGLLDSARVVTEGSLLLEAAWAAGRAS